MKACACCKEPKPFNAFHLNKRSIIGVQSYCKSCRKSEYRYGSPEIPGLFLPELSIAFERFLSSLSLQENKQKVYREASKLSFQEVLILIKMTRRKDNDWKQAA